MDSTAVTPTPCGAVWRLGCVRWPRQSRCLPAFWPLSAAVDQARGRPRTTPPRRRRPAAQCLIRSPDAPRTRALARWSCLSARRPDTGSNNISTSRVSSRRLVWQFRGLSAAATAPSVPDKLIARSPHAIWIDLVTGSWGRTASGRRVEVPRSPGICLDDLHPVPVVIAIDPRQIDVHHQLKVSLYYPKGAIRRYRRPVVVTVPPLATARTREEVRVARSSNLRLFSIFPKVPGERQCLIPDGSTQQRFAGICQTSVRSRPTHEPSVSVTFTERWWPHCPPMAACSPRALRHHTWRVIEGETIVTPRAKLHVYATRSRGARAPQLS
jgi:hypothetical protein